MISIFSALSYFLALVLFFVFGHPQELRMQQAKKMSKLRLFQHSRQVHHKRGKGVLPQKTVSISISSTRVFPQKCVVQAPLLSDSRGNSGVAEDRTSFFLVVGFINSVRYILMNSAYLSTLNMYL